MAANKHMIAIVANPKKYKYRRTKQHRIQNKKFQIQFQQKQNEIANVISLKQIYEIHNARKEKHQIQGQET